MNTDKIATKINAHISQVVEHVKLLPESRERSVAQTHLDTAMLWLRVAVEEARGAERLETKCCEEYEEEPVKRDRDPWLQYSQAEVHDLITKAVINERNRIAEQIRHNAYEQEACDEGF
jgi:hypothetical protein